MDLSAKVSAIVRYACEEHVALASKPAQPIAKGLPGPGLLAHLTLSKYGDYLPLYRLEDILSRSGVLLRRSTLRGWIADVADLNLRTVPCRTSVAARTSMRCLI